jgi:hypothetical protein
MNNAQSARMLRVPGNIGAESPGNISAESTRLYKTHEFKNKLIS